MDSAVFNEKYYDRYYFDRQTRVAEPAHFDRLARFIHAYASFLGVQIRAIADLGCGVGTLKAPLKKRCRKARYVGVDISPYACEKHGWELGCVSDFQSDELFDLVVCNDVVQYLAPRKASQAINNFATLTTELLYFSVLTSEDWESSCDQTRTDGDVFIRPAAWYRKRLSRHFKNLGGGLYLKRDSEIITYALEHAD